MLTPPWRAPAAVLWAAAGLILCLGPTSQAAEEPAAEHRLILKARDAIKMQQWGAARDHLDELIAQPGLSDPVLLEALRARGSAQLRSGDYQGALLDLSSAMKLPSDSRSSDVWLLWQRCWAQARLGKFLSARRDCDEARWMLESARAGELSPGDRVAVAVAEAELYELMGRPEVALSAIDRLLDKRDIDRDPLLLARIGKLRYQLGDDEGAVRAIETAEQRAEGLPATSLAAIQELLGSIYLARSDFESAWNAFVRAYRNDPSDLDLSYSICAVDLRMERYDRAINSCEAAYSRDNEDPNYVDSYGLALLRSGKLAEAEAVYRQAIAKGVADPYIDRHLAEIADLRQGATAGTAGAMD